MSRVKKLGSIIAITYTLPNFKTKGILSIILFPTNVVSYIYKITYIRRIDSIFSHVMFLVFTSCSGQE